MGIELSSHFKKYKHVLLFDRDGFGEVARLVDVAPLGYGDVVREELERDGREQREALLRVGNLEGEVGECAHVGVALGDYADDPAPAGLDLLDVAEYLVVVAVPRRYHDRGHLVVDQRDRAVLHLRGGVSLGVDV